jgi:LPXTG-motif cell wall-anchored protein
LEGNWALEPTPVGKRTASKHQGCPAILLRPKEACMYTEGGVLGATVAAPVVAAAALPNTGSSEMIIAVAVAVVAGLLVWGRVYARNNR